MHAPSLEYVSADGIAVSPPTVEFDVPAEGSAEVEFTIYDFTGNVNISLEDIPLRVEPTIAPVTAEGTKVVLTFYGDKSLGSQVFNGKIRFLAMTGDWYAYGIKVRATIHHIAAGVPPEKPNWQYWLPREPWLGPPLPKFLNVYWPWYTPE